MEEKLLTELIKQVKTLQERQGETLEALQAVKRESKFDFSFLEARLTAAVHLIDLLIQTHPQRQVLHNRWSSSSDEIVMREEQAHRDNPGVLDEEMLSQAWLPFLRFEIARWGKRME